MEMTDLLYLEQKETGPILAKWEDYLKDWPEEIPKHHVVQLLANCEASLACQEGVRIMKGEAISVHSTDNHSQHIQKHQYLLDQIVEWEKQFPGILAVMDLYGIEARIKTHIAAHEQINVGRTAQ